MGATREAIDAVISGVKVSLLAKAGQISSVIRDVSTELRYARRYEKVLDRRIAHNFNYFDYIPTDENTLSNVIADLLTPDGKHGQGNLFLKIFLSEIEWDHQIPNLDLGRVIREAPTSKIQNFNRRIDILIDFEGTWGVAIENKPYALDQPGQLSDYLEHLRLTYKPGHYLLIYLSKSEEMPSDHTLLKKDRHDPGLHILSYRGVFSVILRRWRQVCQADRVRYFLICLEEFNQSKFAPSDGVDHGQ